MISHYELHAVVHGGWVVDIYINKLLPNVRIQIQTSDGMDAALVEHYVRKLKKRLSKLLDTMEVKLSPQLIATQFTTQPQEEEYGES